MNLQPAMLTEQEINEIFSNLEGTCRAPLVLCLNFFLAAGIYELNKKFFSDLTDLKEERNLTAGLGK